MAVTQLLSVSMLLLTFTLSSAASQDIYWQDNLDLVKEFDNSNKLVVNQDKTHLLVMGSKKSAAGRREVSIKAGPFTIFQTESEKLLGGQLHQSLEWNNHLCDHESSLVRQLTTRINGLKKISANATFNTRLMVHHGVLMSKMVEKMRGQAIALLNIN